MPKKQIIAIGGGGFSDDTQDLILEEYVLEQTARERPAICFLATASGDAENYRYKFYESFSKLNCRPSHLSLFQPHLADLEQFIMGQDVIYVGGGNTKSLLALWREWGLDALLSIAYERGIILAGVSAGAICWFEQGVTDSIPGELTAIECLGLLSGSCCPHFDSQETRRPAYLDLLRTKKIRPGYGIDDWAGLHFVDGDLWRILSARPESTAYKLSINREVVKEVRLEAEYFAGN